ncbi:LOW QUALITY PROTEIN: putative CCR4-associated factor 1 7 [Cinnamomum micranthum f. kanehirae]|uniref:Putative CCR4-associated factor 1 7 n=1 Tax=Cinnamomum micranthum f. kanehirae TaxID=337451 RepID=A0A3S3N258_9MAGN|nr:LOW QUALITY PROTEIN: putative CCR4-associated factor 1 7 [Cinnamomum micranthum f. kanehirae]
MSAMMFFNERFDRASPPERHRLCEEEPGGIDANYELHMTSGIMLNEDVQWITFHSDFGYLLTCQSLTDTWVGFFHLI